MRVLALREQSLTPAVVLNDDQVVMLQASRSVTLSPTGAAGTWDLRTNQYVGVVHAPDLEVRIRPKVAVENVLFLLGYAADPNGWRDAPINVEQHLDIVPALAFALAHHSEEALRRGVLQDYTRQEDALVTLRGRLREGDQLRRRFGFPVPVEVAWDEYTVDIAENRVLLTATRLLLTLGGVSRAVRPRLLRIIHMLEGVSELRRGEPLPPITHSRLNQHYRQALTVARLVLTNRSTDLGVGGAAGVSFLFDMNRVFEDFLSAALPPALGRHRGVVVMQHRDVLDHDAAIDIRPDLSWWDDSRCLSVIDAKYKSIQHAELPNADVYQMLAYCIALECSPGWLVYAAGNEEPTDHDVRNSAIQIRVAAIDLDQRPADLLRSVEHLADSIATSALPMAASLTAAG